jgi:CO dehydrogenase maturation factor
MIPGLKPFTLGISGKGGVGKTTIASIIIRCLIKSGIRPVLAVDADPNANLHEALGVLVTETLGSMREEAFTKSIPAGLSRTEYVKHRFRQVLVENEGFDLIAMGRPEGQGCYCFANDLLTEAMQSLKDEYKAIIIDNEAGMEHMARGTVGIPDILMVVTDPGARGMRTAERIEKIGVEIGVPTDKIIRIVNRVSQGYQSPEGVYATIPMDPIIDEADIRGNPVSQVPQDSIAVSAVCNLVKRIMQN